jgi:hypothetical protein
MFDKPSPSGSGVSIARSPPRRRQTAQRSAQPPDEIDLPTATSGDGGTETHVNAAFHERAADADGYRTSALRSSHCCEVTICRNWNVDQDELADAPERRVERHDRASTTVDPEMTTAFDDVTAVWHGTVQGRPRNRRLRAEQGRTRLDTPRDRRLRAEQGRTRLGTPRNRRLLAEPGRTRLGTPRSHGSGLGLIRHERSRPASLDARYFGPRAPVQRRRRHRCGSIPRDGRHGRHSEPRRLTKRKHDHDEHGTHEQQPEQTQIARRTRSRSINRGPRARCDHDRRGGLGATWPRRKGRLEGTLPRPLGKSSTSAPAKLGTDQDELGRKRIGDCAHRSRVRAYGKAPCRISTCPPRRDADWGAWSWRNSGRSVSSCVNRRAHICCHPTFEDTP